MDDQSVNNILDYNEGEPHIDVYYIGYDPPLTVDIGHINEVTSHIERV